jgi:SAM-dependent methyltransferase
MASVRVLMANPPAQLQRWREQLGLILAHASDAVRALAAQAAEPDVSGATLTRLQALARSIAEQADDLSVIMTPALGQLLPPGEDTVLPRGATDYLSYLFRDWAWPGGNDDENAGAVTAIRRVTGGQALGRTLVVGAGACRLAYDLHLQAGATETAVVDVDPFLLVIAEAIIRGAALTLTETSVNAPEIEPVSKRWTLAAPSGALAEDAFHFVLADGLEPPFADQTFDTVVTPWFIDQVPTDLHRFVRRVHRLLVPGGRWVNRGPLLYRPDMLPIGRWYARQEIFDLATAVGFDVGAWESGSHTVLVSPLTGRGLIENVLTFVARRT